MAGMYPDNQEVSLNGEKILWPGVDASGKFTDGDFDNPLVPPSFIPAGTINLILDNLSELIKKLGGTPDNTSIDQLAKLMSMASQGDPSDANSTQGTGLVKTANRNPNEKECQQNEPWAASPNWVYNLLLGNAASEVNTAVTGALKERLGVDSLSANAFRYRGVIKKADLDKTVVPGSYGVDFGGSSGALLVFVPYGSTGVVQFYKDGYQNEPWMCRNAIDSDQRRWTEWNFIGVQLTIKEPNKAECQRNRPWAASPNWVYNLLLGNAASEVNTAVTGALKERLGVDSLSANAFRYRGVIKKADLDKTVVPGSYGVDFGGSSGALLVFVPYGSTGVVQFYKDGYENELWMCRNAIDSDQRRWTEWQRFETFENIAIKLFSQYTFAITYENAEPPSISGYRWELASGGSSVYPVRPVGTVGPVAVYRYWSLKAI